MRASVKDLPDNFIDGYTGVSYTWETIVYIIISSYPLKLMHVGSFMICRAVSPIFHWKRVTGNWQLCPRLRVEPARIKDLIADIRFADDNLHWEGCAAGTDADQIKAVALFQSFGENAVNLLRLKANA